MRTFYFTAVVTIFFLSSCTYLYLKLMGYVASQLKMPISCQCRSSLFLNALIDGASTTSCGNLFHSLTIRELKKFCLIVVRHLGLNNFIKCPLSPLMTSASSKNLLKLTCSFPVSILNVSIKSPHNLRLSREILQPGLAWQFLESFDHSSRSSLYFLQ